MKRSTFAFISSLAFGAVLGFGGPSAAQAQQAQPAPGARSPGQWGQAAQTSGTVSRYLPGPMGHIRGFVLNTGAVVLLQGRLGDEMSSSTRVGQQVRVEGLVARNQEPGSAPLYVHATVYAQNGTVLAAPRARRGPDPQAGPEARTAHREAMMQHRAEMQARLVSLPVQEHQGTVQSVVRGPRGAIRALLLQDGTTVFLAHKLALEATGHGVRAGEAIRVSGRGGSYPQGASLMAEALTFADGKTLSAPIPSAPAGPQRRQ